MIRYRRDINDILKVAEILEEVWEPTPDDFLPLKGLRFVGSGKRYRCPLKDYELKAINEGWIPPGEFVYLTQLPKEAYAY